jgi:hypothetical protein
MSANRNARRHAAKMKGCGAGESCECQACQISRIPKRVREEIAREAIACIRAEDRRRSDVVYETGRMLERKPGDPEK